MADKQSPTNAVQDNVDIKGNQASISIQEKPKEVDIFRDTYVRYLGSDKLQFLNKRKKVLCLLVPRSNHSKSSVDLDLLNKNIQ